MKFLLILSLLYPSIILSQNISTYLHTNNNGIYGALANPGYVSGSSDWLSINVFGVGTGMENNVLRTNLRYSPAEIALLKPVMHNQAAIAAPYFETSGKSPKKPAFFINTQVVLPSFKINLTPKFSVFVYMRERVIGNIVNVGQDILGLVVDKRLPTTLSPELQMDIRLINLHETGAGFSAIIYDKREARIKAGVTVKLNLARFACLISTQDFAAEPTPNGVDITARYRFLMPDSNMMKNTSGFITGTQAPGHGYSTDIGFVYEYRPYYLKHRYRVANPKGKNKNFRQRDIIQYVYRVSASLNDVGHLLYEDKNSSDKQYEVRTSVDPRKSKTAESFLEELTKGAKIVSEKKQTKLYLPTTFNLAIDYRINSRWFLNLAYSQNLRNTKKADVFYIPTTFTGLLRKELRSATHGIPLRVVPNTHTATVGWFSQFGPFFIGTDNALILFKRKMYNWSFYTGVCFVLKYKKDPTIENFKAF